MKPSSLQATLVASAVASLVVCGCGDLSNDDLIFLGALPTATEVALNVEEPVSDPNALIAADQLGAPAEFYLRASQIARDYNGAVEDILTLVESLGVGTRPTLRETNRRVWGPYQNVDGKGLTFRLEIVREELDEGQPRFTFCFQAGRDEDFTGGRGSCDEGDQAGLGRVLWGFYEPRRGSSQARSGSGVINFDLEVILAFGGESGLGDSRGQLTITYDFTDGGDAKTVGVEWRYDPGQGQPVSAVNYSFSLSLEGAVDFFFQFTDPTLIDDSPAVEIGTIDACMEPDGSGRADVLVEGGDLAGNAPASAIECWNDLQLRNYFEFTVGSDFTSEGAIEVCPDC